MFPLKKKRCFWTGDVSKKKHKFPKGHEAKAYPLETFSPLSPQKKYGTKNRRLHDFPVFVGLPDNMLRKFPMRLATAWHFHKENLDISENWSK